MTNIIPDGFFKSIDLDALDTPAPQDKPFSSEVADEIKRRRKTNVDDRSVQALTRARAYLWSVSTEGDRCNLLRFTNRADVEAALDALNRVLQQVDAEWRAFATLAA